MKIIEIIPQLNSGGAERFVVDLCNELSKQHEVYLVVLHNFNKYSFYLEDISSRVSVINMDKKDGMDFGLFLRLNKLIASINPDVVHTHLSAIIYASLASIVNKHIRFIHTVHNDAEKEAEKGINKLIRKFVFRHNLISPVTISEESQKSFQSFYNLPSTLIYNGCFPYQKPAEEIIISIRKELHDLKVNKDALTILNVARIQPQKNQVQLAEAIHNLNLNGDRVELFHIGSVANKEMENSLIELRSPYVHLLGKRNNPRDYMYVADAFCLSSVFEGMPITLIECFSVGTIPVCTPVGGIVNMITDGENGLLARGCSQQDLKEALMRFANLGHTQKQMMRTKSLSSFKNFNISSSTAKYVNLMNTLIN